MRSHHFHLAVVAAALAWLPALTAAAGTFQELPSTGPDIRVRGTNSQATDPLYLGDDWTPESNGYTLAAPERSSTIQVVDEDDGDLEDLGIVYDRVYRNNTDGTYLFATRLVVFEDGPEQDLEINHVQRFGYTGFSTAAGWYFDEASISDFRLRSVARTADYFSNSGAPGSEVPDSRYDPDVVTFNTDISIAEGALTSGWYAIKTNATQYGLLANGLSIYQAEDGEERLFQFTGLAPVPEPSEYALMGAGLLVMAAVMRRRKARGEV